MLGYRSFFQVPRRSDVVEQSLSQLHAWLREKRCDADALVRGQSVRLAPRVDGLLLESAPKDGSHSVRARITDNKQDGRWITQLTVHVPARHKADPWVWVDVEAPPHRPWTDRPRLLKYLLEVFPEAADGTAALGPAPRPVGVEDVRDLLEVICDRDRRGLVFLAADDHDLPLPNWAGTVGKLLKHSIGLAGAYVLDGPAVLAFEELTGQSHAVTRATIRSYRPGVDPADELDARRHRVLSTDRILNYDQEHLARMLGKRAREAVIDAPLPRPVMRINSVLDTLTNEVIVGRRASAPAQVAAGTVEPVVELPETITREQALLVAPAPVAPVPVAPVGVQLHHEVYQLLVGVLGGMELTQASVVEFGRLVRIGRQAELHQLNAEREMQGLRDQLEAAEGERRHLAMRLVDEQLEQAVVQEDLGKATQLVRRLQRQLAETGQGSYAWTVAEQDEAEAVPDRFDILLDRVSGLRFVEFCGDNRPTLALDHHDESGNWPRKTWDALLALDDYAQASADGRCPRDVHGYLQRPPDGCRGFSTKKHARDESEDVRNNPGFRAARMLPVPAEVTAERRVFMGAHFKIAQSHLISPRLHYHDDTARTGKVYVGYIGKHLPTKQTN